MTKLIAAAYGPSPSLLDPALRARLASAGATRIQVNVDDEAVAPALRFGPGEPITGLVTVWTTDVGASLAALTGIGERVHVWRVTERRPIEPPPVADGTRADTLANVALLRRPETMSREDYLDDWLGRHTPIAMATQATFGYVQNIVEEALTPGAPQIAAIVEELFPMAGMHDMHAFYGSGGDGVELQRRITTLMDSVARFGADTGLDLVPTSRYLFDLSE